MPYLHKTRYCDWFYGLEISCILIYNKQYTKRSKNLDCLRDINQNRIKTTKNERKWWQMNKYTMIAVVADLLDTDTLYLY